ncbi:helix-turn-helix domain-containing protein [Streptomyces sp. NPDC053474]|uniref:helix-turn-helix domain-containing protein n=1 Tax=Streptomyces sp. NPDC053474 TaxID=3365704 RepID=UPI0037D65C9A
MITEVAETFQREGNAMVNAAFEEQGSAELLAYRVSLERHLEALEAAVIRRGRARGESWEDLAAHLSISAERLRKKWTSDALNRRLEHTTRPPGATSATAYGPGTVPRQRPAVPLDPPPADGTDTDSDPPGRGKGIAPRSAQQQLAAALSFLQSRSGRTLRHLAGHAGISPSYVSRVLAGERRPSWPVTKALTQACAEDASTLYPLWRTAHGKPLDIRVTTAEQAAQDFHRFLRGLHIAAALPDAECIARRSHRPLTPADITQALTGQSVPDWPTTARLVMALQGQLVDIRPLWHAARTLPRPPLRTASMPADAFG